MKRKLLAFGAGAVVAFVGFYLMLFLVLGIWGLNVSEWASGAMVAIPTGLAVVTTAWVIRRDAAIVLPALAVGLVAGAVIAFVAELFVDSLELSIVGVAATLAIEAVVLDPGTDDERSTVGGAATGSNADRASHSSRV